LLYSGGNAGVVGQVREAEKAGLLVDNSDEIDPGNYYREGSRQAPHNLYAHMTAIRFRWLPHGLGAPAPLFTYRDLNGPMPATAVDAAGVGVDFGRNVRVNWIWDAERKGWDRFQVDERHPAGKDAFMDANGGQIAPDNVVILYTPYGVSEVDARSPKALSVADGDALVLTNVKAILGRWKRDTVISSTTLTDLAGQPILLTPGRTWVEMPEAGGPPAIPIGPDEAQQYLARRG
jgi:hypothetical protein